MYNSSRRGSSRQLPTSFQRGGAEKMQKTTENSLGWPKHCLQRKCSPRYHLYEIFLSHRFLLGFISRQTPSKALRMSAYGRCNPHSTTEDTYGTEEVCNLLDQDDRSVGTRSVKSVLSMQQLTCNPLCIHTKRDSGSEKAKHNHCAALSELGV